MKPQQPNRKATCITMTLVPTHRAETTSPPTTVGAALRARQIALRLRQREAAERIGVTPSVYSRWVGELTLPSMTNLPGVARFLELDQSDVLAMMPESFQIRATANDTIDELRADIRGLRDDHATTNAAMAAQLRALTKAVDRLTQIVAEQLTQNDA